MWANVLHAQSPTLPLITNYSAKEYGAHAQTFGTVQDERGVLYFANVGGVLEFDGKNWREYNVTLNGLALSIGINAKGTVFAGGIGEFGKLAIDSVGNQYFTSLSDSLPDELKNFNNVWNVHVLGDQVYFNAGAYFFLYENDTVVAIAPPNGIQRSFIVDDELWYQSTEGGIFRLLEGESRLIPGTDFFKEMTISGLIPFEGNQKLIVTRESGMFIYSPLADVGSVRQVEGNINAEIIRAKPYGMVRLSTGQIAINTLQEGIFILSADLSIEHRISRAEGLQNETVLDIFEDADGHLWSGTDNGICFIALNNALSYANEGIGYKGAIQSITKHNNDLYLATIQGVYRFLAEAPDGPHPGFERVKNIPGQCFDFLTVDGELLVASYDLYTIAGLNTVHITRFQARVLRQVEYDAETPAILAGGQKGVMVLTRENGNWREGMVISEFPDEVQDIEQEFNDFNAGNDSLHFWISTWTKGTLLLSLDQDLSGYQIRPMNDSTMGLPRGQITFFKYNDQTYFATTEGTHRYDADQGKFTLDAFIFPERKAFLWQFQQDKKGEIWCSSGHDIYHIIPENGGFRIDSVPFMSIDIGGINALYTDDGGTFWLGGDDALISYDQNLSNQRKREQFSCLIRKVVQGADSLLFGGQYAEDDVMNMKQTAALLPTLEYKENSISFEFSTTYFEFRDKVQFAHQLVGYESEFSAWNEETKAVYTNLLEGSYTFRVKARNVFMEESSVAEYQFNILPPWYRTWWAYVLYGIGAITLFVIVARLNARRIGREKERLEELVKQRTAELDEKNIALESQNKEILEHKALVEEKNRDITDSILYAEKIQQAILTSTDYMDRILPEHFIFYQPKDILSGDFYWAYGFKDADGKFDKVMFAAVDCTGHGVPGALMSMIGNSLLNEIVVEMGTTEVDQVLNELRTQIIKAFGQTGAVGESRDGMDMTICLWDKKRNVLEFAGAKSPLYVIRGSELLEYKGDNQPISYYPKSRPFSKQVIELLPGDMLYTFSDGFIDQFGGVQEKKFLSANFRKLLLEISDLPPQQQKERIIEAFENWKGDLEQVDDVCVFGVKV